MSLIRITGPAHRDITKILRHSDTEFGDQARQRYQWLIDQALQDLGEDASRAGVLSLNDIREGYFLYRLKWSRKDSARPPVRHPRHLIAFYIDDSDTIMVARLFHERQMLTRHLMDRKDH